MSTPLAFAGRLLEQEGALVEARESALEALVPREVGSRLGMPEHVLLSEDELPGACRVGYGTELLDRLVGVVTGRLAFASGRVPAPGVRESMAARAAEGFVVRNGVFTAGSPWPSTGRRLWLHAVYTLEADERREGLVSAVVSLGTGTAVEGYAEAASPVLEPAPGAGVGEAEAARAVRAALEHCRGQAEVETAPFRQGAERRFTRDRERVEAYFEDLLGELARRASKGRLDAGAAEEKRQAVLRERAAKAEALASRQRMELTLRPVAALVVQSPAFTVPVELRRRKASRQVELEYDAVTRRLVPLACEGCARPTPRPAVCDERLHVLCETCAPRVDGRLACRACRSAD